MSKRHSEQSVHHHDAPLELEYRKLIHACRETQASTIGRADTGSDRRSMAIVQLIAELACFADAICDATENSHDAGRDSTVRIRSTPEALEALGALPQRTCVGHGARRLQPVWKRMGISSLTTRPVHAPTAGMKTAWPASATGSRMICFALALWNERDPILKERIFGLTGNEGNHGEDVKEYYFYLDSTPTHSYMKYLYKYPQAEFPYGQLVEENRRRGKNQPEFELLDTGVFNDNRYFDVFVEYAKADTEDILIKITVANRGPEAASLRLLPTVWFRNTWSWGGREPAARAARGTPGAQPGDRAES